MKLVHIPGDLTKNGRSYTGFADDETADALLAAFPGIDVTGDPGDDD